MHPLYKILTHTPPRRGPYGTVWLARDEVLGHDVALKELCDWASRPTRARACFEFAHTRQRTLFHPNLVPVHGLDSDRGWIVLDHYASGSMRQEEPTPPDRVRRMLIDVLEALSFLHGMGFLHGAVKPTNLFQVNEEIVLLSDALGIRLDSAEHAKALPGFFRVFDSLEAKYLAPECLDGKANRVGPGIDAYALGWSALELLLGEERFTKLFPLIRSAARRWDEWHVSEESLPPLRQLAPETPSDLAEVVDRLICKDLAQRLTIEQAIERLTPKADVGTLDHHADEAAATAPAGSDAAEGLTATVSSAEMPLQVPSGVRRGRLVLGLGGGFAGLVLGLVLAFTAAPRPTPQVSEPTASERTGRDEKMQADLQAAQAQARKAAAELERHQAMIRQLTRDLAGRESDLAQARLELEALSKPEMRLVSNTKNEEAAEQRERAERLAGELKDVRGELTRTIEEAEKHRVTASKLSEELRATKASLAHVRAEVEQHKARQAVLPAAPARLVATPRGLLQELGAKFEEDNARPSQPVIKIDLTRTKVTNEDLVMLTGLNEVRWLSLSATLVTDSGLAHLKKLTKLQSLHLASTHVTDLGLAHLRELPNLQDLDLAYTPVSDAGLLHLKAIPRLRQIYLTFTRVTPRGVADLRQSLPGCQVQHESLWPSTTLPR